MDETPKAKRRSRWLPITLAFAIVLPPAYVVSYGPALRLWMDGTISEETGRSVYAPIEWARERSPAFRATMRWWVSKCMKGKRP